MPSRAFNYREASWDTDNCSMLQKKASIMLGLQHWRTRSVTGIFAEFGLELATEEPVQQAAPGLAATGPAVPDDVEYQQVPYADSTGGGDERLFGEIGVLKTRSLDASVLRSGVQLDRYQVASTGTGDGFRLFLQADQPGSGWNLATFRTREEAICAANDLRRLLVRLNTESEGFQVVEHIILRPSSPATPRDQEIPQEIPEDFYNFTVSVIFPAWTARFHDEMFRRLAEETVETYCPAYIYPEFHWLDFPKMREFEGLYQRWLAVKASGRPDAAEVDAASALLKKFILLLRAEGLDGKRD